MRGGEEFLGEKWVGLEGFFQQGGERIGQEENGGDDTEGELEAGIEEIVGIDEEDEESGREEVVQQDWLSFGLTEKR